MTIQLRRTVNARQSRVLAGGKRTRTIALMALVLASVCARSQRMAGRASGAVPPGVRGARVVAGEVPGNPSDGWNETHGLPWFNDHTLVLEGGRRDQYHYHIDLVDVLARRITNITPLFHLRRLPSDKTLGTLYASGDGKYVMAQGLGRVASVPRRWWRRVSLPPTWADAVLALANGTRRVFQLEPMRPPFRWQLSVGDLTHLGWIHRYSVSAASNPDLLGGQSFTASGDTCTNVDWMSEPARHVALSIDSWTICGRRPKHTYWTKPFTKTQAPDIYAASGDGKWMAWYHTAPRAGGKLGPTVTSRIWCCSASHRQPVVMCTLPALPDEQLPQFISWSPSGARLAFFVDHRLYVTENPLLALNAGKTAERFSGEAQPPVRGAHIVPGESPNNPNDSWEDVHGLPWFNDRTLVLVGGGWGQHHYHIDLVDVLSRRITNITPLFRVRRLPPTEMLGTITATGDSKYVMVDGFGRVAEVPPRESWKVRFPYTYADAEAAMASGTHRVFQIEPVREPADWQLDVGDLTHLGWIHKYGVSATNDPQRIGPMSFAASGDTCTKVDWVPPSSNPAVAIDSWTIRGDRPMHKRWTEVFPGDAQCDSGVAAASGNGKWLAWWGTARTARGKMIWPATSRIWCCSANRRRPVVMCTLPGPVDDQLNRSLSWSPSGARLAFFVDDRLYVTENPLLADNAKANAGGRRAVGKLGTAK